MLNPLLGAAEQLNTIGAALATAINDWQIAEWLDPEPRMRASICVPFEDAELAAAEVDRVAGDRRFVQIQLLVAHPSRSAGERYWKLYEAAVPPRPAAGIHYGGWGGAPIHWGRLPVVSLEDQAAAWPPPSRIRWRAWCWRAYSSGFPTLKVVLIKSSFGWLGAADN